MSEINRSVSIYFLPKKSYKFFQHDIRADLIYKHLITKNYKAKKLSIYFHSQVMTELLMMTTLLPLIFPPIVAITYVSLNALLKSILLHTSYLIWHDFLFEKFLNYFYDFFPFK